MANAQLSISLITTEDQMVKAILSRMKSHLTKSLGFAQHDILRRVKDKVQDAITSSDEYQSLMGGRLQAELGLNDPANRLKRIFDIWLNEIEITKVDVKQFGDKLGGGFTLKIIKENMRAVLNTSEAKYKTAKDVEIPWLSWLLEAGDSTIVRDYEVSFKPNPTSRTGLAIMVGGDGKSWSVPAEYSGILGANFVTRALAKIVPDIAKIIEEEVLIQVSKP